MLISTFGFSGFLCLLISLKMSLKHLLLCYYVTLCVLLAEVKRSKIEQLPYFFFWQVSLGQNQGIGRDTFLSRSLKGQFLAFSNFYRLPTFLALWPSFSIFITSNIEPRPSHTAIYLVLLCLPPLYKVPFIKTFVITLDPSG